MIIWSGFGFLVPLIVFLTMHVTGNAFRVIGGDRGTLGLQMFIGLTTAAVIVWLLGKYLNRTYEIDKETGEKNFLDDPSYHSLFFIPMHWWSPVLIVTGVLALIKL